MILILDHVSCNQLREVGRGFAIRSFVQVEKPHLFCCQYRIQMYLILKVLCYFVRLLLRDLSSLINEMMEMGWKFINEKLFPITKSDS